MTGRLVQVNVSHGGMPKLAVPSSVVTVDGLAGDWQLNRKYHGGPDRAVCLFSTELYDRLRDGYDIDLAAGTIGENFTTAGVDLDAMAVGSRLRVGACVVEVTGVRVPCRSLHKWTPKLMAAIKGHSGWVCRVAEPGTVWPGDVVEVLGA